VRIFNTKHPLPINETAHDDVIPWSSPFDVRDTETVSIFGSPDFQLIAVVGHRLPPRYAFIRFYESFDQDRILGDTSLQDVQAGGVFRASIDFDRSACDGMLTWQIDNPGTASDRDGSGEIEWLP
jgi:hypothetical protein